VTLLHQAAVVQAVVSEALAAVAWSLLCGPLYILCAATEYCAF
jgi:hypothetical protein